MARCDQYVERSHETSGIWPERADIGAALFREKVHFKRL
jgi:hypothetical protein